MEQAQVVVGFDIAGIGGDHRRELGFGLVEIGEGQRAVDLGLPGPQLESAPGGDDRRFGVSRLALQDPPRSRPASTRS